jgi:hypothetical protein
MHIEFWCGNFLENIHLEDLRGERITLISYKTRMEDGWKWLRMVSSYIGCVELWVLLPES